MGYPIEMREAVVKKVLSSRKPHYEIAKEAGISRSTLGYWIKSYKNNGMKKLSQKEKRPQEWTAEERITALIKTGSMLDEEQGAWCRKHGLHTHHLEQWKKDAIAGAIPKRAKGRTDEDRRLRQENKELKKELRFKEKALAETAALLVLKKKAQSIWGEPEDD